MRERKIPAAEFLKELQDIYNIIARNNERLDHVTSQMAAIELETNARLSELIGLAKASAGIPDKHHMYSMKVWMEEDGIPRVHTYSIGRVGYEFQCDFPWPLSNVKYWTINVDLKGQIIRFSLPGEGPLSYPIGALGQWVEYRPRNLTVKVLIS